jgi:hypothetical protein
VEEKVKVPRPYTQVGKNAQCVLDGSNARVMATRMQMMMIMDNGKDRINRERRNNHTFKMSEHEVGYGCLTSIQMR